jgi:hypothetical protein
VATNTAVGVSALQANTVGANNVAVGYQAGYTNSTGASNTFVGDRAGKTTTGGLNTFVGALAGQNLTSGTKNTIIGAFDGNQDGLNIRTADSYVVLSDGDGLRQITMAEGQTLALDSAHPTTGTGITFPATQSASSNANTLDDYEEGTFTASVTCGSGTITLGIFTSLSYTKIGRMVSLTGYLYVSGVSSPSGSMKLNILPYPINSSNASFYIGGYLYTEGLNATAVTAMQFEGANGDSFVSVRHFAAGTGGDAAADFKAASTIIISLSYFV